MNERELDGWMEWKERDRSSVSCTGSGRSSVCGSIERDDKGQAPSDMITQVSSFAVWQQEYWLVCSASFLVRSFEMAGIDRDTRWRNQLFQVFFLFSAPDDASFGCFLFLFFRPPPKTLEQQQQRQQQMAASSCTIAIVLLSILYRWLISLFPHSGSFPTPLLVSQSHLLISSRHLWQLPFGLHRPRQADHVWRLWR